MPDSVFQSFAAHEPAGILPFLNQLNNPLPHVARLLILCGCAKRHCGRSKGTESDRFGKNGHRIGGAVHGTGSAGKTDVLAVTVEGFFIDPARPPAADGFFQIGGYEGLPVLLIREHGTRGQKNAGQINRRGCHQHSRNNLIAGTEKDKPVKMMRPAHGFNGSRD